MKKILKEWWKPLLIGAAILGIAAAGSQRTPLLRAFLQSNMDANGFNITNLQGAIPGAIVSYNGDGGLTPTNVTVTSSNAIFTNLTVISNAYITTVNVVTGNVDNITVTNGITNLQLTANTVLKADGGKQIASIPNGTGALTNDGAGNFGWDTAVIGAYVAAGTNIVVDTNGITYTVSVRDPLELTEADAGTLVVTNPPFLNLANSTNYPEVLTNDGAYVHLRGTVTNSTAPWAMADDGELLLGTNALAGNLSAGFHAFGAVTYNNSNQVPALFFDLLAADYTGMDSFGLINGSSVYSQGSASWSLLSGTKTGSTNTLALQSHTGSAWFTAKVDTTNRASLPYTGIWDAQGYVDESGTVGALVAYGAGGRLVPTNITAIITNTSFTTLYAQTNFSTNLYSSTAIITNLSVINEFVDNITITNGITNLSLTANTVLQTDARKVITNEVAAVDLLAPGNHTFSGSNYFSGAVTLATNTCNGVVDFSKPESLFSTNNAVVFAAPINIDLFNKDVQWILVNVTNTTAAAVTITAPANCHTVGTAYCTNLTQCWFQRYAQAFTNMFCVPVF